MSIYYREVENKVEEIHTVTVHSFTVGDVDDPDIYAGEPLYKWQNSEQGKWIMDHAIETPVWQSVPDLALMGHRYIIRAKLRSKDLTYFLLKWNKGQQVNV